MAHRYWTGVAALALLAASALPAQQVQGPAQPPETASPPAAPAATPSPAPSPAPTPAAPTPAANAAAKQPSDYVRCDGRPDNISAGETAARLISLSLVVGLLVPPHESADYSKRLTGKDGVDACTAALARETDAVRRTELMLARAVHRIEAGDPEAAIAEARAAIAGDAPVAQERGYRLGIALSAREIEVAALLRLDRVAEAEAAAEAMAAAAPWDALNQARAARYIGLTDRWTPEKAAFFEQAVRVLPEMLPRRADAREWAGDYAGSAGDLEAYGALIDGFRPDDAEDPTPVSASASMLARRSVDLALAGDMAKADALAADARKAADAMIASADAIGKKDAIAFAEEMLDFEAIASQAARGDPAGARTRFAARSRWFAPSPPLVAALAARLREGAKPADLTGALARDPEAVRREALTARRAAIVDGEKAKTILWASIRPYIPASSYSTLGKLTWRTDKSKYLIPGKPGRKLAGEVVIVTNGAGSAAGDALLLHCALIARQRQKTGFALFPLRGRINTAIVRFGNAGDPGMPADVMLDADAVIAALTPAIPPPPQRK